MSVYYKIFTDASVQDRETRAATLPSPRGFYSLKPQLHSDTNKPLLTTTIKIVTPKIPLKSVLSNIFNLENDQNTVIHT